VNVSHYFAGASCNSGQQVALGGGLGQWRRQVTYAELDRQVDAAVQVLVGQGLQPGDKVLLAVPQSIETYVAMLAILKAGLVVMFIDPAHGAVVTSRCLRAHPPAAVVGTRSALLLRLLLPELRKIRKVFVCGGRSGNATPICDGREAQRTLRPVARSNADSALLTFTSGSSGTPKAVLRTHGFLRNQMNVLGPVAKLRAGDIDLVAMPMFVLLNLANNVTSILPACSVKRPGRAEPRAIYAQLRDEHASRIVASPALLERLANHCLRSGLTLDHLHCVATGGGPVSPSLPDRLAAIAPKATIRTVYGSTEAEPIAAIDREQVSVADKRRMREGRGLLVGRPVRGCDLRILRDCPTATPQLQHENEFRSRCLERNQVGEIVVAGKHVLPGYADQSFDAGTKLNVDGRRWHRTGDAGYIDDRGRLWLLGRCAAAIRDPGGTIYPFQIEYAACAVRGIRRAALLAQHRKKVLVLETSARDFEAGCIDAARCSVAGSVDRIVIVRHIPMDRRHDAKVDYPALQRMLESRIERLRHATIATLSMASEAIRSLTFDLRALLSGRIGRRSGSVRRDV